MSVAPTFHQDWTADRGGPWQLTGAESAPTYDVGRGILSIPVPPGGYGKYGEPEPAVVVLRAPWDFGYNRGDMNTSEFSTYRARSMTRSPESITARISVWLRTSNAYGQPGPAAWRWRNADHSTPLSGNQEPVQLHAAEEAAGGRWSSGNGFMELRLTSTEAQTVEVLEPWAGLVADDPGAMDWPADPEPEPEPEPEPDPEPEPGEGDDAWDVLAQQLAPKVAGYAGGKGDTEMIELAESQLPIVVAFVHGYTRGKGFDATDMPVRALRAVIVSAASRLVVNPEQTIQYSSGDYSETSARLLGFTIPERMTLNNYRRVSA